MRRRAESTNQWRDLVSSQRILARRIAIVSLVAAMLVVTVAIPVVAATGHVSGTVTFEETVALSRNAVAIVTVVDQAAAKDAGAVIGEQRIDGIAGVPIPFSVPYDQARIDPTHAYGLYATVVDGATTWQNLQGIAVLTGGPTDGVAVPVASVPAPPATLTGTITKSDTCGPRPRCRRDRGADQGRDRNPRQPAGPADDRPDAGRLHGRL